MASVSKALGPDEAAALEALLDEEELYRLSSLEVLTEVEMRELRDRFGLTLGQMARVKRAFAEARLRSQLRSSSPESPLRSRCSNLNLFKAIGGLFKNKHDESTTGSVSVINTSNEATRIPRAGEEDSHDAVIHDEPPQRPKTLEELLRAPSSAGTGGALYQSSATGAPSLSAPVVHQGRTKVAVKKTANMSEASTARGPVSVELTSERIIAAGMPRKTRRRNNVPSADSMQPDIKPPRGVARAYRKSAFACSGSGDIPAPMSRVESNGLQHAQSGAVLQEIAYGARPAETQGKRVTLANEARPADTIDEREMWDEVVVDL